MAVESFIAKQLLYGEEKSRQGDVHVALFVILI
jgi:hypothetical protein